MSFSWPEGRGKWSVWRFHWLIHHRIYRALERARPYLKGTLLDVGCGTRPFARAYEAGLARHWGCDLPDSRYIEAGGRARRPDVYAPGDLLPFADASFDSVLSLSVINYVADPGRLLDEARRVLKPGGHLVMEFMQMGPIHREVPDYFRYTPQGARLLLERAGFEIVEVLPLGGLWARSGLAATEGLQRINRGPTRLLTELPVRAMYVGIHLAAEALDRMFFDPHESIAHVVVARRKRPHAPRGALPLSTNVIPLNR